MPIRNADIAAMFEEMADLLEIQGANEFRVRSYRQGARTVDSLSRQLVEMVEAEEDLTELSDIGESLADKIVQIVQTGRLEQLDQLRGEVPAGLLDILNIEGVGPKRTEQLWQQLGVETLDELEEAAEAGEVRQLDGFGEKTEQNILEGIERARKGRGRTRLDVAEERAEPLLEYLRDGESVEEVVAAGSYRRRRATVGDLDLLVVCGDRESVMERLVDYDEVVDVASQGETRSTVRLRGGLQVDLRAVAADSYGAALHYFTGSKEHNIACRQRGVERGLKINEYGVFEADEEEQQVAGATEEEIYETIEMAYVPPELREKRGEIEAAADDALPDLVTVDQVRGDLHTHTDETDGRNTLREMVEAAREFGHDYYGVTDHSENLTVVDGMDAERLRAQMAAIDELNEEFDEITILKGCEVDILKDGTLDLDDEVLGELDYTVCSIHQHFRLGEEAQTERVLRAMENPNCTILGHLTGRLIGKREAYAIDVERILEAAAECGVLVEVNAQPQRLDLRDIHLRQASQLGVPVVIETDAHSTDHLRYIRYGVDQARRGWLEADDVANTRPLDDLLALFDR
jgi:DNA polymerase (family 10)